MIDGQRGETLNAAVARRLRGKLAEHRISASEVARKIGMTQAAVSRRTTGQTPIDLNELQAICDVTSIDMHFLLTGESPHPAGPNGGECAVRDLNPEPADLDAARRRIASRISYAPLVPIAA